MYVLDLGAVQRWGRICAIPLPATGVLARTARMVLDGRSVLNTRSSQLGDALVLSVCAYRTSPHTDLIFPQRYKPGSVR